MINIELYTHDGNFITKLSMHESFLAYIEKHRSFRIAMSAKCHTSVEYEGLGMFDDDLAVIEFRGCLMYVCREMEWGLEIYDKKYSDFIQNLYRNVTSRYKALTDLEIDERNRLERLFENFRFNV